MRAAERRPSGTAQDTSIATYAAKRRFSETPEPAPGRSSEAGRSRPLFVVQKHHARRLHWDFRLQHGDVLWSWAVPKGPAMTAGLKRLAVRTEDHPLSYATFEGTIPEGNYGAGVVERWDGGLWEPVDDAEAGLAQGELKFRLFGERLQGGFVLVRLKPRPRERGENWLLIKEREGGERKAKTPSPDAAPALPRAARRAALPSRPKPQLATAVEVPPTGAEWLHEIKFDGYRLLAVSTGTATRLLTRSGLDWTAKLPRLAASVTALGRKLVFDGELVALDESGLSRFGTLQQRIADGRPEGLAYKVFDLLHVDGHSLASCRLDERKRVLKSVLPRSGPLHFSDHLEADAEAARREACALGLEGIISKRADAPSTAGRTQTWLKLKCVGRDEFVVVGWTPPAGSRVGLGALHLAYNDPERRLRYAGGVGTGFDDAALQRLAAALRKTRATRPKDLVVDGPQPEQKIRWVDPRLVVEIRYGGWTEAGRLRHAVFLGERLDKETSEVVMTPPATATSRTGARTSRAASPAAKQPKAAASSFIVARAPRGRETRIEGVRMTHPNRVLWPGITKQDLARYWLAVADRALPELAGRPLAMTRFPEGIDGESFFQKHAMPGQPRQIRAAKTKGDPYLAIDDASGLVACAQLSAIELHAWGATEADPDRPDRLVFDLDPGEGVAFKEVVAAAQHLRKHLAALKLEPFCRTTGGKGLHLVVPLAPDAEWERAKHFARMFATTLVDAEPERFVATVSKAKRKGRILIDWLRNGRGATAIASYSPRGRPGATVATPLAWREVTARLDPQRFTIETVPARIAAQRKDPWAGFEAARTKLPKDRRRRG